MHLEFLVEDESGKRLLKQLLSKMIHPPHTFNIHGYKGIGHVPKGLKAKSDPAKRMLLNQLPRLLEGFARNPHCDAVVVLVDSDRRDTKNFKNELESIIPKLKQKPKCAKFSLAIEELEAWYLGDETALKTVFPHFKKSVFKTYKQDSICGTWEKFGDIVVPEGHLSILNPGKEKCDWAEAIGPFLDLNRNKSPSFNAFVSTVASTLQN